MLGYLKVGILIRLGANAVKMPTSILLKKLTQALKPF